MAIITIKLKLSSMDCLKYYEGTIKTISVTAEDGRVVNFPANMITQFIDSNGVLGRFNIEHDVNGKVIKILKI